jgi:signal transduction histidine kinase
MKNAAESSKIILSNLKRAADLIRSFKQVAVDQSTEKRRLFNLGKYIDEVLVSLRPETKRAKHTIAVNCPGNFIINSFPGAFSQIITNFVMNSLTHGFKNTDTGSIAIDVEVISDKISFRYSDNGVGISQEDLGKIYEPFFTTNRQAGDSGLGLNIVYNVVTVSLGGTIECTSTEGGGTVFHVEIPNINGV